MLVCRGSFSLKMDGLTCCSSSVVNVKVQLKDLMAHASVHQLPGIEMKTNPYLVDYTKAPVVYSATGCFLVFSSILNHEVFMFLVLTPSCP